MAFDAGAVQTGSGFLCKARVPVTFQDEMFWKDCNRCGPCLARMKRDRAARASAEAAISAEVVALTLTYREGEPGAYEFIPKDRQGLLRRLRSRFWREAAVRLGFTKKQANKARKGDPVFAAIDAERVRVVFMGCGERGKQGTRRRHWHINLYLSKPSGWSSSERDAKGKLVRETRDWWPHGFVTVDVMGEFSTDRRVAAARYVQKYAEKGRASGKRERRATEWDAVDASEVERIATEQAETAAAWLPYVNEPRPYPRFVERRERAKAARRARRPEDAVFFQSLGKAYGASWIESEARRTAQAGLPYHGTYMVPGVNFGPRVKSDAGFVRWSETRPRGQPGNGRKGGSPFKPMQNRVQGACRKYAIAAYREEWEARFPGRPIPATEFMRLNDPDFVEPVRAGPPLPSIWAARGPRAGPLPPLKDDRRAGVLVVQNDRGVTLGAVQSYASGAARFWPVDDAAKPVWLPAGDLSAQMPMLGQRRRQAVESWLADKRGPGWLSPRELRAEYRMQAAAQFKAMAGFAKPSPSVMPLWLEPEGPVTGLRRFLIRSGALPDASGKVAVPASLVRAYDGHKPGQKLAAATASRDAVRAAVAADLAAMPDLLRASLAKSGKASDAALLADPERLAAWICKRVERAAGSMGSPVGKGWLGQRP